MRGTNTETGGTGEHGSIRRWRRPAWRWAAGPVLVGVLLFPAVALARPHITGVPSGGAPASLQVAGADPILIGAGDIAECFGNDNDEATAKLLDAAVAGAAGPVAVFTAGDNAYPRGTEKDFVNCYAPTWGRHEARTYPSAGNHEYKVRGAAPYFKYFGAEAGDPKKGYYSYTLGTWHIIVLNSNCREAGGCEAGSAQERWLRADLAANTGAACTLAYWHHPRFSNGNYSDNSTYQPFWQALYDYGAEVVLAGHDHNYQRYAPLTPAGARDDIRGIRQFVVGTGGKGLYALRPPTALTQAQSDTSFGVLRLTLRAGGYDWQFLPASTGGFTDSGFATCHP